jgi:hypothetical protein
VVKGSLVEDRETDPNGAWIVEIDTAEALYLLLEKAPHERVRRLLRDFGVQVFIKHPWPKEERALHGRTPPAERVIVRILTDPEEPDPLRPGQANSTQLA